MADYRRILIIKPSSLGDVVHALPFLAALRDRFPKAFIAWFVKRQWAGLLERAEGLDAVWPVEPTLAGWLRETLRLRTFGFDLVVDLQGLLRSGLIARLTGCPARIGFTNAREGSPWFYTQRVPVPTPDMHAVDRYLLVASSLGAVPRGSPEFRLRAQPGDGEEVAGLLRRHGLKAGTTWIAMNVGARWPTKRWPPEFFAAAADRIRTEGLGSVVLLGGPEDRELARAVKELMRTVPINLTGATTPGLLPALLGAASLLLTNDSGPMHVAVAMGTPVVALFGPTSAIRTGPYGAGHRVLSSGVACSPCFSRVCRNPVKLECLIKVSPEQVMDAVRAQLARQPGRGGLS
ncbi:MAG: lipopolysaccharide heptosyltransferase II [Nitrospiraceae bacterium]